MENNQPITKKEFREELGRFTEEILLPAVEKIVDEKVTKIVDEKVTKIVDEKVTKIVDEKVGEKISGLKLDLIDYFDDKIADLRGDIVLLLRREDRRVQLLIDKLRKKNILGDEDVKELDEVKLFVQ